MRTFLKHGFLVLLALFLAWLGGLVWFVGQIPREPPEAITGTDAIVVLTGGTLRLEEGFDLLARGLAKKLFISGAGKGVRVHEILDTLRKEGHAPSCCGDDALVVLGFEAADTVGNAQETARWMERERFRSLRLVTANYHLPRALREFSRVMPEVMIIPYPVFPDTVHMSSWWRSPGTLRLIVLEYDKLLLSAAWHRAMGRGT